MKALPVFVAQASLFMSSVIYLANVFENLVWVRFDFRQWSQINEQNRHSPCPGGGSFSQPTGSNKQAKPSLQQTEGELEEKRDKNGNDVALST